ncbi:endonuclease/exonuclease/phosphatase family protein [Amycolatopsis nigrescens]|uniref:endonuclease/exonuclease/phosphatase family protein n=1 Tax=Amycolatopsis nigrescens TaxID=381445 RepID=UPI000379EBAB|nr:endonuclease/exonuclease/phosphatase family protein [Amycolatopsis nigrescens]
MRLLRLATAVVAVVFLLGSMTATAATPSALRVLSYNIHAGIGADAKLDLARTARVITDSGADVVGLQEVDVHWSARSGYADQAAELAALTGMRVYFAPIYRLEPESGHTEPRQYGVALLSRYPILAGWNHQLTRLSTVDPNPVPAPAPGFAEVLLRVPGGPLRAYVTHLDFRPDPAIRQVQVGETVHILDRHRGRQVLFGDFNAEPSAPELAPLFGRLPDAWPYPSGGLTYPAQAPVKRIDYVTSSLVARSAQVPVTPASDHLPVLTELSLR